MRMRVVPRGYRWYRFRRGVGRLLLSRRRRRRARAREEDAKVDSRTADSRRIVAEAHEQARAILDRAQADAARIVGRAEDLSREYVQRLTALVAAEDADVKTDVDAGLAVDAHLATGADPRADRARPTLPGNTGVGSGSQPDAGGQATRAFRGGLRPPRRRTPAPWRGGPGA